MRLEDFVFFLSLVAMLALIIYMIITFPRGPSSSEYVTYEDFYDFQHRIYTLNITFYSLILLNMATLWYRIGRLEALIGKRRGKGAPEEFY